MISVVQTLTYGFRDLVGSVIYNLFSFNPALLSLLLLLVIGSVTGWYQSHRFESLNNIGKIGHKIGVE